MKKIEGLIPSVVGPGVRLSIRRATSKHSEHSFRSEIVVRCELAVQSDIFLHYTLCTNLVLNSKDVLELNGVVL